MKYKVKLSSVGNPDFGQNPNARKYGAEKNKFVACESFKQASELCIQFIRDNELGGGNWSGGLITESGKAVARVSYNGRVWEGSAYGGKEIEIH